MIDCSFCFRTVPKGWLSNLFTAIVMVSLVTSQVFGESRAVPLSHEAPGFVPLFNGKDLSGWKGLVGNPKTRAAMPPSDLEAAQKVADEKMSAHWKVVDGVLEFDGKGDSLCTTKDYGDFELFVDWKILEGGDSGIYLRGSPQVQIWDTNFEAYFQHGAEKGSGAFWNNAKNPRFPSAKADKPVGEWNTFFIRMIGERASIYLNGQLVVDNVVMENLWERDKPIYRTGQIELQNHGNTLFFRNISIREIPAEEVRSSLTAQDQEKFTSLFNGQDFTGWKGALENYEVKDGTIACREGQGGNVLTEKEYSDFVARLEFKVPPGGNNGLAVRFSGTGEPHLEGLELQVLDSEHPKYKDLHPAQYHGSIYGLVAAQRGFLNPAGEWNYQQITARGSRIKVELNGFTIVDADLSTVTKSKDGEVPAGARRKSGFFGFAGHQDPVAFRNISIRELPGEAAAIPPRELAISPQDGPIKLFNGKNLEGMYTWIKGSDYSDPKKIFTVHDGMIHILGDGYGGVITNNAYRDYHLILEFKWGERTWAERVDRTRDSGLLLHCWGPDGGYSNTWMASIEAQIIEGGVGDILVLQGADPLTGQAYPTQVTAEVAKDRDGETIWKKGGEKAIVKAGRVNWSGRDVDWVDKIGFRGRDDVESKFGEWTKMEVLAEGDRILYKVNGVTVNEAFDCQPSAGKLLLQTELAEMFVRRFELWPIGKAPQE